jgi:hypothetical protein
MKENEVQRVEELETMQGSKLCLETTPDFAFEALNLLIHFCC